MTVRVAAARLPVWALGASLLTGCAGPVRPEPSAVPRPVVAVPVDQGEAGALVSAYRASRGLGPVAVDADLRRAAQAQVDAMASANQLSHTVAGALPARLAAVQAGGRTSVENVSAGYPDLKAALAGWRRSAAHDANLLFRPVRRIGVAAAVAPGTRYKTFWALVMTD